MSCGNTNSAELSADCQIRSDTETSSIKSENSSNVNSNITEMSLKQLQAITFLNKTETALEKCLNEEKFSDYKEIQNAIKNLAIILKNGEEETKQCVIDTLNKDGNKVLFLLQKSAVDLFNGIAIRTYV